MNETHEKFVDLIQLVDEDDLAHIVEEVDELYETPGRARSVARGIIYLRDDGDPEDRRLAVQTLRDYLGVWLHDQRVLDEP